MVNGIESYEFQEKCVEELFRLTTEPSAKKIVTIKAPTGAGKTVILVKYVDTYLKNMDGKTAFIWLCPGKGNLEEQSKDRMEAMAPNIDARSLLYSMLSGFVGNSVTFINWEMVTKKQNNVLKESERKNLFEKIEEARQDGVRFIVIIDEEHENNTAKAKDIIDAFKPVHIIRVSATPQKVEHQEFYEIPEEEVIDAGLITRAIYVNEGVVDSSRIEDDYDVLLKLAEDKRKEILEAYQLVGANIRPLVLIQFPVGQPETIEAVEKKLEEFGYTCGNGMVSVWMADRKDNLEGLTDLNGTQNFLLMKQAVATGWDCPRAKILVKLREGGSEQFQIQTIGRIRRMPERKHYGFPSVLDYCYIYTLDKEYRDDLLSALDKAYQVRKLFSKKIVRDFMLTKQMRNLEGVQNAKDERIFRRIIYDFFKEKYHLGTRMADNQLTLESAGYSFSSTVDSRILQGVFRTTEDLSKASENETRTISIQTKINTHNHGIYLMRVVGDLKNITGIPAMQVRYILEHLFRKTKNTRDKFTALEASDFYAFIINNGDRLKQDFREIMSGRYRDQTMYLGAPKEASFSIPDTELYKFGIVKKNELMEKNAYEGYTNEFLASSTGKSTPERLFEEYCETDGNIAWVYKNGDTGQQYFSVVYDNGIGAKQSLFYPDYIVKTVSGDVWIIETKGGMQNGHTKNIDMQVMNKFNAFKDYATHYGIKWGFVRDIDGKLFICNTEYTDDMYSDNWYPLNGTFSD